MLHQAFRRHALRALLSGFLGAYRHENTEQANGTGQAQSSLPQDLSPCEGRRFPQNEKNHTGGYAEPRTKPFGSSQ